MQTGIKVLEAMTERPIIVTPDTNLVECAEIMKRNHVGSLLVKEDHKLRGILTEQDIVRKAVVKDKKPSKITASDIMEITLRTIAPENDIFDALQMMRDYNIRHIPVTENEKLIGLVTLKDILKIQPDLFEILVEKFELKEEQRKPVFAAKEEGLCESCGEYSPELKRKDGVMICSDCRE
ncbi:CBS domain-containing protein [Candidatus Woesearchaeota archaeon]|nr:CBS domain-containing protein [Candidatus Woesearchaeota archaeon]